MNLRVLISLGISFLFLVVFLYIVPLSELKGLLSQVKPESLLYGFLIYTFSQLTRSLRWTLLLKGLGTRDAFLINSANIFMNNLLPARTGELSWFYYAKRLGYNLKSSLWSFLVGRAYALLGLISLLVLSLSYLLGPVAPFLVSVPLILLSLLAGKVHALVPSKGKLTALKDFLKEEFSPSLSIKLYILSTLSFFLKALSLYVLTYPLIEQSFPLFSFAFAGGELTTILPIHGFMGYGTYETGFLLPLKYMGIEIKEGIKVSFLAHSFLLLSSAVWGLVSIGLLHILSRRYP